MRLVPGRRGRVVLLAALVVCGAWLLRVALWRPLALVGEAPADGYARVAGVVHVHTTLSDGGGTPEEVIRAARAAGLGFLGITDHNNLDAKPLEGYRDGVLVLVGSELSTPAGHVLGLGLDRDPPFRFNGDGLDGLEDVRDLGGVPFAAHPFSARADLRWSGWGLPGPWGMELLNGDSDARGAGPRLLLSVGLYLLNPDYALLQGLDTPREALGRWDEMLARRDVAGLAGSDAHSRLPIGKTRSIRFPSYEALFAQSRNHLLLDRPLTGEAGADRAAVLDALGRGRFYIGLDALAPAADFRFTLEGGAGERWTMGDHVSPGERLRARVGGRVPRGTRIVLLRDGREAAEAPEALDVALPGPGVYRVEARVPGWPVPWVVTNPVYVHDEKEREARARAAAWAGPPPPPREVHPLASLDGSPEFRPEFDPSSWMDADVRRPDEGPEGAEALKLAFRLAAPTASQPFTWCALVNRQPRDLSGYAGLRFLIRADGEYGLWVQVRDANPASADEGLEWWLAAARTSPEWREVRLPFARFRTINRKTDGRLDPGETRALVFVLDGASVKAGTSGTIWIADVGVYR
ncbi:MAG TPA: CehA/McbA family metallohydrolase [Vicinamibacteria bacterium]|nr:CehA/McbA family metallohydrolase [Vicinamibacteria bacterium]